MRSSDPRFSKNARGGCNCDFATNNATLSRFVHIRSPVLELFCLSRMPGVNALVERLVSRADESHASHDYPVTFVVAAVCLIWYIVVCFVSTLGFTQL